MSDLNMSMTSEEQEELESKLVNINGGQIVLGFSSIANSIVSKLLVTDGKPASMEEEFAILEIYGNCVKKIFGVDPVIMDAERIKAYRNFQSIITTAEEEAKAREEAQHAPKAMKPEDVEVIPPEENAIIGEAVPSNSSDIVDNVRKVTEASNAVNNVVPIEESRQEKKETEPTEE